MSKSTTAKKALEAESSAISNLERFRTDLDRLLSEGDALHMAFQRNCTPDEFEEAARKKLKDKAEEYLKRLPDFDASYQPWYSEAKSLISQILPNRLDDFVSQYEKPKNRKVISFENYVISDALQGLRVTRGYDVVADCASALPELRQQLAILKAVKRRFESSLFEIRQLVQADLFDSELDASRALLARGFVRAAGAVSGVVLEGHLKQVCADHNITFRKKNLTISDCNDALKTANVLDVPHWRKIQLLGDLRNLCDHKKDVEPTKEQVRDLIDGTNEVIKTVS